MPFFKPNDVFAGRYQLVELMGEGDLSEVWAAKDQLVDDAMVVLKMYAPGKGMNEAGIQQYRREYSLSQYLSHPHLLKVTHFEVSDGVAFLLMPYCSLGTLDRLKDEESFTERQVALVMSQIGSALAALHRQEPPMRHGDIKPGNIVMSAPDHFLLANFGISSLPTQTFPDPHTGQKSVTIAYAPPETFDRFLKTNQSGDIFSLGVTLFEMCTRTIPWNGGGGQSLMEERHSSYIGQLPKHYSSGLSELLHACMSLNNFQRPSAEELHLRGKHFLETGQWDLPGKENKEARPQKKLKPYLLAASVAALLIVLTWAFLNEDQAVRMDNPQYMNVSGNKADQLAEEELMIDMLEYELEQLAQRSQELEEENRKLRYKDSVNTVLLKEQEIFKANLLTANKERQRKAPINEKVSSPVLTSAPTPKTKKSKEDHTFFSPKDLEHQLNKISDPELPEKERTAWKKETLAHFSGDVVRILDETEGAPRQYSASIFLNLLMNVPHTIVVKEVKRDQYRKITELRLSMHTKM